MRDIGVLWSVLTTSGKISNAGNYLICERGKNLLETYCGDEFNFVYIERTQPFNVNFDGLIILGGPVISRSLHNQSKNIIESIEGISVPIFCLGLGIAGKKINPDQDYFRDDESKSFWKGVYQSSKLFSVRDKISQDVLNKYGIKAELTGCPALFNLVESNNSEMDGMKIDRIAISIPHFTFGSTIRRNAIVLKPFLITLFFLYSLKKEFREKELGLVFQHGIDNPIIRFVQKYARWIGMKTYDYVGKSLDSPELAQYDAQIGTRLHSHINFLALNKPSFLFNVDLRTDAFLSTISTPSANYTFSGIKKLIKILSEDIRQENFNEFRHVRDEISKYFVVMKEFIRKIVIFYEEKDSKGQLGS